MNEVVQPCYRADQISVGKKYVALGIHPESDEIFTAVIEACSAIDIEKGTFAAVCRELNGVKRDDLEPSELSLRDVGCCSKGPWFDIRQRIFPYCEEVRAYAIDIISQKRTDLVNILNKHPRAWMGKYAAVTNGDAQREVSLVEIHKPPEACQTTLNQVLKGLSPKRVRQ